MTNEEAMNLLMKAYGDYVIKGGRGCGKTAFRTALIMGVNALKVLEQYMWERDIALSQLEELGLGFGAKVDRVKTLIDRDKEEEAIYKHEDGTFICPSCGASTFSLVLYGGDFCQHCGKRVKWRGVIKHEA